MQNNFVKFLKDNDSNDLCFETKYKKIKVHKEKYDNRFTVLYSKQESTTLKQDDYEVAGYYDNLENTLYNGNYEIIDIVPKDNSIFINNFENIITKLCNEIYEYMSNYVIGHAEEYRKLGQSKFTNLSSWEEKEIVRETEAFLINDNISELKIDIYGIEGNIKYSREYNNKKIVVDYLNNSKKIVKEYADKFINENKEELGKNLLVYEYQLEHLKKVKNNIDNKYDYVYVNKKILESIKDLDAKTLTITINYNGNEITFKYDFNRLLREVQNADYKGYDYCSSYQKVRDFLNENNIKDERNCSETEFNFENITSISYGKKILYEREKINIELNNDDFDLEK